MAPMRHEHTIGPTYTRPVKRRAQQTLPYVSYHATSPPQKEDKNQRLNMLSEPSRYRFLVTSPPIHAPTTGILIQKSHFSATTSIQATWRLVVANAPLAAPSPSSFLCNGIIPENAHFVRQLTSHLPRIKC